MNERLDIGRREVPCNGCTRCCRGDHIRLLPEDDASQYITVPHKHLAGERMIAHNSKGECVYLTDTGCSIHDRAPRMCREMDCRLIAVGITYTEARKLRALPMAVWRKGRELLRVQFGAKP